MNIATKIQGFDEFSKFSCILRLKTLSLPRNTFYLPVMKGRFAPSPTGRMHLGNVYSALLSWLSAKSQDGAWLLRIEDIDPQRSRQEFADQLMDDLRWLGMEWDEGPFYQSQRGAIYEEYLAKLQDLGLTYPCYCTRADILATQAPHESDGRVVYKGTCRPKEKEKGKGESEKSSFRKPATRLIVPDEEISFVDNHYGENSINLATHCGDFILRRADGAWAYQLAVVIDDALMGITEVVRGRDLLLSVPQQIYLHRLLGFTPPTFCHLPLLCNQEGQRLCKRDRSLDLGELRKNHTAEEIVGQLAFYAGIIDHKEPVSAKELILEFSWKKVPLEDIRV